MNRNSRHGRGDGAGRRRQEADEDRRGQDEGDLRDSQLSRVGARPQQGPHHRLQRPATERHRRQGRDRQRDHLSRLPISQVAWYILNYSFHIFLIIIE